MRVRNGLMGRGEVSEVIEALSRAEGCWTFNARDRMPRPSRATAHHVVENAPTETRAPLPRERVRSSSQPCRSREFRRRSPNRAHSGRSALAVGMRPDAPNRKLARYGSQPRRADAPATKRAADRRSYARSEPCQDKNVARLACNQEIESVLLPAPRSEPFAPSGERHKSFIKI